MRILKIEWHRLPYKIKMYFEPDTVSWAVEDNGQVWYGFPSEAAAVKATLKQEFKKSYISEYYDK